MPTVVGVFDTQEDAEMARAAVIRAGFDAEAVRVQSHTAGQSQSQTSVPEEEGFMSSIGRFFRDLFGSDDENAGHYAEHVRRGGSVVAVTVEDDSRLEAARSALATAGAVDIDRRTESWREEGYAGFDPAAAPYGRDEVEAERSRVVPVMEETLDVSKRPVDLGAVRVVSHTESRPVEQEVELREERAEIQRRAVDRPATEADLRAFEGQGSAIELQETGERAVVNKSARVVEEVSLGKRTDQRTQVVSDDLRRTVVDVERDGGERSRDELSGSRFSTAADPDSAAQSRTFSATGDRSDMAWDERRAAEENYQDMDDPAYRYGSTLRSDQRYANHSWEEVEDQVRMDWSREHPNSNWEQAKAAMRSGWEAMTGRR